LAFMLRRAFSAAMLLFIRNGIRYLLVSQCACFVLEDFCSISAGHVAINSV
jgi:hypothetical protein